MTYGYVHKFEVGITNGLGGDELTRNILKE